MPFKKGESGNPSGRKPKSPELKEVEALARSYSLEALEKLAEWMRSDNAKASSGASNAILDRAFGKPKQAIVGGDPEDNPIALKFIELRAVQPK